MQSDKKEEKGPIVCWYYVKCGISCFSYCIIYASLVVLLLLYYDVKYCVTAAESKISIFLAQVWSKFSCSSPSSVHLIPPSQTLKIIFSSFYTNVVKINFVKLTDTLKKLIFWHLLHSHLFLVRMELFKTTYFTKFSVIGLCTFPIQNEFFFFFHPHAKKILNPKKT